jgi:hypothetical protein
MRYDRIFGLLVVFIMLGSLMGIAANNMGSDEEEETIPNSAVIAGREPIDVNGFYFYEDPYQESFEALIVNELGDGTMVPFRTDPRNISHIKIEEVAVDKIVNSEKIYLVFNPNTEDFDDTKNNIQLALAEVSRLIVLVNVNGIYPSSALTADIPNETYDDKVPIKSCNDSTSTTAVLLFTINGKDEVKMQGDCTIVSGKTSESLIATADKFSMHLLGLKV